VQRPAVSRRVEAESSVVLFRAGQYSLALAVTALHRIHEKLTIEPVADTQPWFLGLSVAAGRLLPVTDLGAFLGSTPSSKSVQQKVLQLHTAIGLIGLCVDDVQGIEQAEEVHTEETNEHASPPNHMLFLGSVNLCGVTHRVLDPFQLSESSRFLSISTFAQ